MDEYSKTDKSKAVATHIPPGTLVLVTPWLVGLNNHYVGLPSNPLLKQITAMSEIAGDVPVVSGCFLSWHSELIFGDTPRKIAVSSDNPQNHRHEVRHQHSTQIRGPGHNGVTSLDHNNSGTQGRYARIDHEHVLSLQEDSVQFQPDELNPEWFEPLHYEVAGYIVEPGQQAEVPPGMIVFHDCDIREMPGWIRLDMQTLGKDNRDSDPAYSPRLWWEETIKVVGCTPDKYRKGRKEHSHPVPPHDHRKSGEISPSQGQHGADGEGGSAHVSSAGHVHSVVDVSEAVSSATSAPNLRRHRKLAVWVSLAAGVEIVEGTLIPYIPQTKSVADHLYEYGPHAWKIALEPKATHSDPVLITSGLYLDGTDKVGQLEGKNEHSHKLTHVHRVEIGDISGTSSRDRDDEEIVSGAEHQHPSAFFEHEAESTSTINPLRYRRVAFIQKTSL